MTPPYLRGLVFIFLASMTWATSPTIIQYIYKYLNFDSPFLLTYTGTSLFVIYLPLRLCYEQWLVRTRRWNGWRSVPDVDLKYLNGGKEQESEKNGDEYLSGVATKNSNQNVDSDDDYYESIIIPWNRAKKHNIDYSKTGKSMDLITTNSNNNPSTLPISHVDHIRIATILAPISFFSNFFFNTSLDYTSITSSTVLSNTSSLFTFALALWWKEEQWTQWKFFGVIMCFCGSVLTTLGDAPDNDKNASSLSQEDKIRGDIICFVSAIGYGVYNVVIHKLCPTDESLMSMQLLFGYVGLIDMVALSPISLYLIFFQNVDHDDNGDNNTTFINMTDLFTNETASTSSPNDTHQLTWHVMAFLIINGLCDIVLLDYLWARGVVLTSATVATVGMGLTIPLAFLSDCLLLGKAEEVLSWDSITGAILVLVGFVLVNIGGGGDDNELDEWI